MEREGLNEGSTVGMKESVDKALLDAVDYGLNSSSISV